MDNQPVAVASPGQLAAQGRSAKGRVTGKLRKAIHAMVWGGLRRKEAAEVAGLAEHSLYQALRRPPVRAEYLAQLEVLRTSARARNIHALEEVRDQTINQAARVHAVRALEGIGPDDRPTTVQTPGLVIVVHSHGSSEA